MTTKTEGADAASGDPAAGYAPIAGDYDEMMDPKTGIRPHWKAFLDSLRHFPPSEPAARAQKLRRHVRETGIAQDLFSETAALDEPWKIDLVPLIFPPEEWRWLEAALIQRARLFAAILDDIYGEQDLLRSGAIPPALVLGDRAFIRPLRGAPAGRGRLAFYAADLARGEDGRWRVIDSHAETVAGSGFALANRVVHSHVMGDLFAQANALRLAPFFDMVQGELLARAGRDDASMALLSPGPHHEDYFGHAYLARYLSLQLAEGGDLRVVGNNLYIKALEGLKPVDLILRCVEGLCSDPLELDPGSSFGPPGFMQALRKHPNLCANAVGTAVVENRGFGPYLGALCREILGEELALIDPPRWWLGDPDARQHVFARLQEMTIRPAQEGTGRPGGARRGIVTEDLSPAELADLVTELQLHGSDYVAGERVTFSTVPSWTATGLRAMPFAVRLYVALVDGEYHVMPGGIALDVGPHRGVALHSPGGYSRDVWVLSDKAVPPHASRLRAHLDMPAVARGGGGALRSRIADNLFWLGRYAERADWIMRLARAALCRLEPDIMAAQHREAVVCALDVLLGKDEGVISLPQGDSSAKGVEQRVRSLLTGRGRLYGLSSTLDGVHHVASLIRDRLSVELWRTLQNFQASPFWMGRTLPSGPGEVLDSLDDGIMTLAAFNGMAAENMTRSYAWTFMEIGRRLERAHNLSELLLALFQDAGDEAAQSSALLLVLEVADSILTYRSRYLFAPLPALVLDLLLIDETNPRSVGFQLHSISSHFNALPKSLQRTQQLDERKIVLELCTRVQLADVHALAEPDEHGSRVALKDLLTQLSTELPKLSEAITQRYFNLTEDQVKRVNPLFGQRA
jgi:uncharacterized circularly permuted ATP-grasp superfamily protein/uncharacterized alpha-E superfamily protein